MSLIIQNIIVTTLQILIALEFLRILELCWENNTVTLISKCYCYQWLSLVFKNWFNIEIFLNKAFNFSYWFFWKVKFTFFNKNFVKIECLFTWHFTANQKQKNKNYSTNLNKHSSEYTWGYLFLSLKTELISISHIIISYISKPFCKGKSLPELVLIYLCMFFFIYIRNVFIRKWSLKTPKP